MTHAYPKNTFNGPCKIAFPHDRLFKESLGYVPIARDFFQHNLPAKVLEAIDLDALFLQPNASMTKDGQWHLKDIVYRVNLKHQPGHLFLLCEHQSSAGRCMALRLAEYVMGFLGHCVKQGYKKLPIVISGVFSHGKS